MAESAQLAAKKPEAKRENTASSSRKTESPQSMSSPADHVLYLQRTIGNQAVQRLIKSGALQGKLRIGRPGDKYEQEADRVMRMPEPGVQRQGEPDGEEEETLQSKPLSHQITPLVQVQRQEEPEEEEETLHAKPLAEEITPLVQRQVDPEEEKEELQAKATSGHLSEVTTNLESHIQSLKGGGQTLPESARAYFEPRFGYDFSSVRVHTDARAAESAKVVNARAYTRGRDVVFGAGQYAIGTDEGRRLMAHELTHVVQQGMSSSAAKIQRVIEGDITQMSITEDWARKLNDAELKEQIEIVRDQLPSLNSGSPEIETASSNLQILEHVVQQNSRNMTNISQQAKPAKRETLTYDVSKKMLEDFEVRKTTKQILFINMPGFNAGMPYYPQRSTRILRLLRKGRKRVLPKYRAHLNAPTNKDLRAEFDKAMQDFEAKEGTQARKVVYDFWVRQQVQAGQLTTTLTEISTLITQTNTALLADAEKLPKTLNVSNARELAGRLKDLEMKVGDGITSVRARMGWTTVFIGAERWKLARQLSVMRSRVRRLRNLVRPQGKRQERKLRGGSVSWLSRLFSLITKQSQEVAQKITGLAGVKNQEIAKFNQKCSRMATSIMDPRQVPGLIPTTKRTAIITFKGKRLTFGTHIESRLAYFANVFNLLGIKPAKKPPEKAEKTPGEEKKFMEIKNKHVRRKVQGVYDAYNTLKKIGCSESEAKILATISGAEGRFHTTQALDMVRFSWGLIQFQGASLLSVLRLLRDKYSGVFREYFEAYGIVITGGKPPIPGLKKGQYPGIKPVKRKERFISGEARGIPSREASGVGSLLVYDHAKGVWVSGNEGLDVIQRDPRYQALFALVGQMAAGQKVQAEKALARYIHDIRETRVTLGGKGNRRTFRLKEIIKNEHSMFGLVETKVRRGNVGFVKGMLDSYMTKKGKKVDDMTSLDQNELAMFVHAYLRKVNTRWFLLKFLKLAGIQDMRTNKYDGD